MKATHADADTATNEAALLVHPDNSAGISECAPGMSSREKVEVQGLAGSYDGLQMDSQASTTNNVPAKKHDKP